MKKIIIAVFALGLFFVGHSVFASVSWNGVSGDCPTINIANSTTGQGGPGGGVGNCWTGTNINANAGDTVAVKVYYHNTGNETALNTSIKLNAPTMGSATFYGQIISNQNTLSFGPVSVNLSSHQTLTWTETRWYPSLGAGSTNYSSENSGVLSGGLGLGSINVGWPSQGAVVVYFKVGPNVIYQQPSNNCYISYFRANGNSSTTIDNGDSVNLTWNTNDCDSVSISSVGSVNNSGNQYVYPTYDRTYTLTAYDLNGNSLTKTVYVYVNDNNNNNYNYNYNYQNYYQNQNQNTTPVYYGSCGVTSIATGVAKTTATLNGVTSNPNYTSASTYFEYGTTQALGMRTTPRYITGNSYFSENISGLIPDTTYYFRLVSNCTNGNAYGNLSSIHTYPDTVIQTQPQIVERTVIQRINTYTGGVNSPIKLKIENKFENISKGDEIDYTITYKNIGNTTLKNPVLQVVVPEGVSMTNTSDGSYSNSNHILTVPLKDLAKNDSGEIYLEAVLNSIINPNEKLVSTATLVYTNSNTVQENAIAYVLNIPKNGASSLGAAALFGSVFSLGLIGWLLIILLVLIIIVVARKLFGKK